MHTILYDYFRSSASYRVRIALNIKGIQAKHLSINLMPGIDQQNSDDYRKLNPQGRVPFFIETDNATNNATNNETDFSLGQSSAILEYIEECYPEPALLPNSAREKAIVRQLASLIACDIHPLNNLSVLKYIKSEFGADEKAVSQWYTHWINEGFSAFETLLTSSACYGKFCFGDSLTMADLYLIPQIYNARRFAVPLKAYPTLLKIDAQCQKLEAFFNAAPEVQTDTVIT